MSIYQNNNENLPLCLCCQNCYLKLNLKIKNNYLQIKSEILCPKCSHNLPACSLCHLPIITFKRNQIKAQNNNIISNEKETQENNDNKFVFCTKCLHGGHLEHYEEWFSEFNICPVSKCECLCDSNDSNE